MSCVQTRVVDGQAILHNIFIFPRGQGRKSIVASGAGDTVSSVKAVQCSALIDTGATLSLISTKVAKELGLVATTKQQISGVHGVRSTSIYDADLWLQDVHWLLEDISLADVVVPDENVPWHVILGMDILSKGTLHFNYAVDDKGGVCTFCI